MGVERAFKHELGKSLEDLSDEWREEMQTRHLPQVAQLERARKFSQPLLTERRSGGQIFLAPAYSPDGKYIAFLSNGSFLKGQVFIDLWLADAKTGKRITRLVKSTFDPNYAELQLLYSQSSFSPDGKYLAFTALGEGREMLYILDVKRRKRIAKIDLPLDGITSPSWSPDGKQLVFSGNRGGVTDLFIVDANGKNVRQLTNDPFGDLQPQWSPDGKTIAFISDRGDDADVANLHFPRMRVALYHLASGAIEVLPQQGGLNINPMWAPDSKSLIFVSNRTGIQNLFLYDLEGRQQYQLTKVVGGVTALTEISPAITWAHQADRLAFTYYEDGNYSIWTVDNPRLLKREPYRPEAARVVAHRDSAAQRDSVGAGATLAAVDSAAPQRSAGSASFYRGPGGIRPSNQLPGEGELDSAKPTISVAALLDSGALTLPDTTSFKKYQYRIRFSPDYVARPTVGYARDNWGSGVFGGTAIVLSDMVGNHQLAFAGAINGRISEAQVFAGYTNLSRRFQYSTGIFQTPYYFGDYPTYYETPQGILEVQAINRYIVRQAFGTAIYPLNRFTRVETGLSYSNLDRAQLVFARRVDQYGYPLSDYSEQKLTSHTVNFAQPTVAYVSDNVLWGLTAPIAGRRYRFQLQPGVGDWKWMGYLADYRRYDPILFNYLTLATRVMANISTGRDADSLRQYLGYGDMLRGYDQYTQYAKTAPCQPETQALASRCDPLMGSRLVYATAELRFPLIRGGSIGGVIPLPPIEGAVFYDAANAWFSGQKVEWHRAAITDPENVRSLLTSHGFSVRVNLFNYVILRWDYAVPHEARSRKGFWQFTLYPPF
jgi:hypothetical protein